MKILWDLYPNHPLLLETSFEPLLVKTSWKRCFGREGANTKIINSDGSIDIQTDGSYEGHKAIYQEFVEFKRFKWKLLSSRSFTYEACGLGFRKGGKNF